MPTLPALAAAQRAQQMRRLGSLIDAGLARVRSRVAVDAVAGRAVRVLVLGPLLPQRDGGLEEGLGGGDVGAGGAGVEGRGAGGAGVDGEAFGGAVVGRVAGFAGQAVVRVLAGVGGVDARAPGLVGHGGERVAAAFGD